MTDDAPVKLEPGAEAPAFALPDQHGSTVQLADFLGRRVLVYFYPKADTPGCTTQACSLRDVLGQVGDTAVVGISKDTPSAQAKFDAKYGLGFPLLSDPEQATAKAFGAWGKGMYGREGVLRSAFLVDEHGRIARAWYRVKADQTASKLLDALGAP
jgi:thioredoxin-dependent peroxiredoxin